jgi:hypothetical protein
MCLLGGRSPISPSSAGNTLLGQLHLIPSPGLVSIPRNSDRIVTVLSLCTLGFVLYIALAAFLMHNDHLCSIFNVWTDVRGYGALRI